MRKHLAVVSTRFQEEVIVLGSALCPVRWHCHRLWVGKAAVAGPNPVGPAAAFGVRRGLQHAGGGLRIVFAVDRWRLGVIGAGTGGALLSFHPIYRLWRPGRATDLEFDPDLCAPHPDCLPSLESLEAGAMGLNLLQEEGGERPDLSGVICT